jgi:3-phosphoshikimate 1-carboxyvinyltransferase
VGEDYLVVAPPERVTPASIATYDDHRMAMSFAVAGTKVAGVVIQEPGCVNKTYPNFFEDLRRVLEGQ